jgi:hypothetical protein
MLVNDDSIIARLRAESSAPLFLFGRAKFMAGRNMGSHSEGKHRADVGGGSYAPHAAAKITKTPGGGPEMNIPSISHPADSRREI